MFNMLIFRRGLVKLYFLTLFLLELLQGPVSKKLWETKAAWVHLLPWHLSPASILS